MTDVIITKAYALEHAVRPWRRKLTVDVEPEPDDDDDDADELVDGCDE